MKHVIVGASAAGLNAAKALRHLDSDADITVVSKDEMIYSRCILHHYLKGKRNLEQLNFVGPNFIADNKINWLKGVEVARIDTGKNELSLSNGSSVSYDRLLLAAGSSTVFPSAINNLNNARSGVVGFRNIEDALTIKKLASDSRVKNIVVLGAGLVGIDVVEGLLGFGKNIALVEPFSHMLNRQLDMHAAKAYEKAFTIAGVKQYYGTKITELELDSDNAVKKVELSSGMRIPCDLFIVTAGVRPNVAFLEGSAIAFDDKGLIFDRFGKTNIDNVYGAGDMSGRSPIWPAAVKEGIIAAYNMVGKPLEQTDFFTSKSTMNFLDIATMSLGSPEPPDSSYSVEIDIDDKGNYKKIIHKSGEIKGAIVQGDLSYAGILTQLIREQIDVTKVKKPLFKIDYSDFFGEFVF
ncbi:MAG: NAD(P)/FAD-dependent oxidoreductase [Defluviitaleaceae bacterium]|nr:NAD(P)/FAD-dependent oxidoreductase [Defluviitaleaceae bacterium]